MLTFNSSKRRFEYAGPDGRVIFVLPVEGGDTSDVPPQMVGKPTPTMAQNAAKFLQGDEAAGDALEAELEGANAEFAQATQKEQQQPTSRTATAAQTGQQGAMLPTADYLNAYVDVLGTATNIADATEKLKLREEAIAAEAKRLGMPVDLASLYAGGAGDTGRFPTTPAAISEAAATNPAYLRAFGGMKNLAAATELNRRQNVLARVAQGLEQRTRDLDLNSRVSASNRSLAALERDYKRRERAIMAGKGDVNSELNAAFADYQAEREALLREQDELIEAERPGWIAWKQQGVQQQIDALPPEKRTSMFGSGRPNLDAVLYGGLSIDNAPTDRDPNNPNMKAPQMGVAPVAPPVTSLVAGAPSGPPGPAPQGQRWVQRGGAWVLEPERESPEAGAALPAYAGGGVFGTDATDPFGAPPSADGTVRGVATSTTSTLPTQAELERQAVDQAVDAQLQEIQSARAALNQNAANQAQQLRQAHAQRMAALAQQQQAAVAKNPFVQRFIAPPAVAG